MIWNLEQILILFFIFLFGDRNGRLGFVILCKKKKMAFILIFNLYVEREYI